MKSRIYFENYDTHCAVQLYSSFLQTVTQNKWHILCRMFLFLDYLQKSWQDFKDSRGQVKHLFNHKKST